MKRSRTLLTYSVDLAPADFNLWSKRSRADRRDASLSHDRAKRILRAERNALHAQHRDDLAQRVQQGLLQAKGQ